MTVTYTVDGSATSGSDYTALSGSVTIQSGWSYADVAGRRSMTAPPSTTRRWT